MSKKVDSLQDQFDKVKLRPELMSITAVNPLCNHNSAARSLMLSSHLSQALTLLHGDEKILQSGIERELGKQTFNRELKNDSRIIAVVPRYKSGVDINSINHVVDAIVIFEDLVSNEISYLELPYNSKMHNYFGFKYNWNHEVLDNMQHNDILPAGTVLASSPAVTKNNGYKFGANLNVCMMTLNETAEDGIIISESTAKKMEIKIFEKRTVEFGADSFMLNLYGDPDNYKPFPEIGEHIHQSGALVAIREFNEELAPALMSAKDICDFNPMFDKVTYVRDGSGVVSDIKVYHTPKSKKEVYSNTDKLVKKYSKALVQYYQDILDVYENLLKEHRARYRNEDLKVSPTFTRLLVDAMAITDSANENNDRRLKKLYRNDPMDIYRIDFTIEYTLTPGTGFKLTDLSG